MADPFNRSSGESASVLDRDVTITGTITSQGAVRIEGIVEGDVQARVVTMTETAQIKGNVTADSATLEGRLEGSLDAREVEIAETGQMEGDVIHAVLVVEAGAQFNGQAKRKTESARQAPAPAPAKTSAAKDGDAAAEIGPARPEAASA